MDNRSSESAPHSLHLQIATFTAARMVFNTAYRMVYPFLLVFSRGLGVSFETLSLVLTIRSVVGAGGPVLASLADSRGRKVGMLAGTAMFIGGMLLVAVWPTFPAFLIAMLVVTLGKYVFDPAMQAYLGDQIAYHRRGRAMAITELSWSLSFILGVPLAGFLIARQGWRLPFPILTVLGLALLLGLAWLLPGETVSKRNQPGLWKNLHTVLSRRVTLIALSVGMLASLANELINLVFGVWIENAFGLQIAALGAASAVIGFSELGGEGLTVWLSDRLGKARAVKIGLFANILASLLLPWTGRSLLGALAGLSFFYLTFEFTLVSSIPLMTEVMPQSRATFMAVNIAAISIGRAVGAFLAFRFFGWSFWVNVFAAALFDAAAIFALGKLADYGVESRGVILADQPEPGETL